MLRRLPGRNVKKDSRPQPGKPTLAGGVADLRDLIAPDGIEVTQSHVRVSDGRYVRTYAVTQLPAQVYTGWLDEICTVGDVDVSVHFFPASDRDVINELSRRIEDVQAQLILAEQRGQLREVSILQHERNDAWGLREELQTNRNKLFHVTILFTVAADSLAELDRRGKLVEERLGGRAIHVRQAFLRQAEAFKSVVPLGKNLVPDLYKNFDLGAATTLLPFVSADIAHPGGVMVGVNLTTGAPVLFNTFAGPPLLTNPHMGIFATSGAGKSFTVKLLAARSAVLGTRTVFIDPEGEYGKLVEKIGGVLVTFRSDGPVQVNPFDLVPSTTPSGERTVDLLDKLADLKGLLAVMVAGSGERITPEELALIEKALREEYAARGITSDPASLYEQYRELEASGRYQTGRRPKPMPTLSSLHKRLAETDGARRLTTLLGPYLRGGTMGLFDGESTVKLADAPLVAFDVSRLEERFLRPLAMHVVLAWVWENFVKRNPDITKRVVVDEAWLFMKQEHTADFLETMARRARKQRASLCVASQNFKEFVARPQGEAVLGNMDTAILMRQNPTEIDDVCRTFKLSEGQREFLLAAGVGEALVRAGQHTAAVRILADEFEHEFLQTG